MSQPRTTIPDIGFLRLNQVLRLIPLGKSAWYDGIKNGHFPAPVKYGRISFWRVEDIKAVIRGLGNNAEIGVS